MRIGLLLLALSVYAGTAVGAQQEKAFAWREKIKVEDIPDVPIVGMLNGEEFSSKFVRVKRSMHNPEMIELEICQGTPKKPCGIYGGNKFKLSFPKAIKSKVWDMSSADKGKTGGSAGYNYASGEKGQTASTTTKWAGAILIENMDGGKVRGKVAVCFGEHDGFKNWVAGRFEAVDCREQGAKE